MEAFTLKAILGVDDQAAGPIGRIKGHFENLKTSIGQSEKKLKSFNQHMTDLKSGAKFLGVGLAATGVVKSLISATLETGKLKSEIKGLEVSESGIKSITKSANKMASQFGVSRESFLKASYDIKSGISSLSDNDLGKFTSIVAKTAAATKSDAAQMSSAFASIFNVFRGQYSESDLDFGKRIGSSISFAVNKFKTDGNKMQQAFESIGASAASMGVSLEEQTVVLGNLMNTQLGGVAGTAFRGFIDNAGKAGKSLSLNFTDAKGHLLPVADILDKIKGKFPDIKSAAAAAQIQKAFGTIEAVKVVQLLSTKTDDLRSKINDLKVSLKPGSASYLNEMSKMNTDNTLSDMKKLSETWKALKEILGEKIAPPFNALITGLKDTLYWTVELFTKFPALASIAGYLITGVAGFATLTGAIKTARATMGLYRLMSVATTASNTGLITSLWAQRTAMWANVKAMWAFTSALLMNPLTWVVIGIVALVAGLVWLVVCWDEVTTAIVSSWEVVKNSWSTAPSWFKGIIALLIMPFWSFIWAIRLISKNWDQMQVYVSTNFSNFVNRIGSGIAKIIRFFKILWAPFEALSSLFHTIGIKAGTSLSTGIKESASSQIVTSLKSGLSSVGSFVFGAGESTMKTFASGVKKGGASLKNTVKDVLKANVKNQLPSSDAKEGPLSQLTKSGKSFGTTFSAGVLQSSSSIKASVQHTLGKINLTPQLPKSQASTTNNLIQRFNQASGNHIQANSLITLNINGSPSKLSVTELARILSQLLTQELNKQEVFI